MEGNVTLYHVEVLEIVEESYYSCEVLVFSLNNKCKVGMIPRRKVQSGMLSMHCG